MLKRFEKSYNKTAISLFPFFGAITLIQILTWFNKLPLAAQRYCKWLLPISLTIIFLFLVDQIIKWWSRSGQTIEDVDYEDPTPKQDTWHDQKVSWVHQDGQVTQEPAGKVFEFLKMMKGEKTSEWWDTHAKNYRNLDEIRNLCRNEVTKAKGREGTRNRGGKKNADSSPTDENTYEWTN